MRVSGTRSVTRVITNIQLLLSLSSSVLIASEKKAELARPELLRRGVFNDNLG